MTFKPQNTKKTQPSLCAEAANICPVAGFFTELIIIKQYFWLWINENPTKLKEINVAEQPDAALHVFKGLFHSNIKRPPDDTFACVLTPSGPSVFY